MNFNICFCYDKLFIPLSDSQEAYLVIYSYDNKRQPNSQRFRECSRVKLPLTCSYIKKIILKVAYNLITGIKCILILIFDFVGLNDVFLYSFSERKQLFRVSLPRHFVTHVDSCHLYITNGPTFLNVVNNKFSIYSLHSQTYNSFNYPANFLVLNNFKILQFSSVATSQDLYLYIIVAVTLINSQNLHILAFNSDQNCKEVNYKKLPLSTFVPEQYEILIKAINIVKFIPCYKSNSISLKDLDCQESVSVVCTNSECLVFSSGVLKYCCRLVVSLSHTMCINAEIVSSFYKNILFMATENRCAYLILLDSNNSQVKKYWEDVTTTTGHLILDGSKQLILLKGMDLNTWQENFIITDVLSLINIDHISESPIPDDCIKTTVSCLQQKIQLGKSVITETEHEISQKTTATIDALTRLKDYKTDTQVSQTCKTFRESLVDLIVYNEENIVLNFPPTEDPVKLIDEKQEFVDDDWVLCFHFRNDSSRCICHPSIKVLVKNKQVLCLQKLFIYANGSVSFFENHYSHIEPKAKFTVILKLSTSTVLVATASIILSWYDGSSHDFDNQVLMSKEEKVLNQHQLCLNRKINIEFLTNKDIKESISCLDDLLFAKLSQNKVILLLSSLHSDINNLKTTLLNSDHNLLQLGNSKCLVFSHKKSSLFGVNIFCHILNEKLVSIEAFVKDTRELLFLVHFLYRHVPSDILISPSSIMHDDIYTIKKDIICAIKNETDLLQSCLNLHNVTEELRKNYAKLMSSQNVGAFTIPKETYQRIRKLLAKKEFCTDALLKNFTGFELCIL